MKAINWEFYAFRLSINADLSTEPFSTLAFNKECFRQKIAPLSGVTYFLYMFVYSNILTFMFISDLFLLAVYITCTLFLVPGLTNLLDFQTVCLIMIMMMMMMIIIIMGSTNVKVQNIRHGNKITCTIKCNYRIAVTLIILETCLFQLNYFKYFAWRW
jgi:hypothetical protein